ncbi:hypothetical protein M436DRAFT_64250 [Aureobasidium namibiae CBS 147.97]|uniref:Uncharacterized protein n=1 Tax=Aureobasidium namibiae CBS 147.97 TaxID=1043004 RepID=A0A074WJ03_9PEZI|nr:uncharacterized protein M436DRAFT_64250 [Aureobasidium namibiae CBS 147.97]KEQ73095.1 hypothetical protein M436DRAFT_64250 [Aureobasidium namibiae CBS 147.97]
MQPWHKLLIVAVIAFVFIGTTLASTSSATAISDNNNAIYLAPLIESCLPTDRSCGVVEGSYMVTLRQGHTPSSHLSYIAEHINVDPVKDWKIRWSFDEFYLVKNVSADSLDIIRRDPGVGEVEQGYWFSVPELDICRNTHLSEEERRICYEEGDLPQCERPSLSRGKRQECIQTNTFLWCLPPMWSEVEEQSCLDASHAAPCDSPKLSEAQQRFCRDGSLTAKSTSSQLSIFHEERRTCAAKSAVDKSKVSTLEITNKPRLRSDNDLAPLYEAISKDKSPDTYIVTLYRDIDYTYHDHFKTIGRNLEADETTAFKWWDVADSYYATNITSDWVRLSASKTPPSGFYANCNTTTQLYKIRKDPAVESIDEYAPYELIGEVLATKWKVLEQDPEAQCPVIELGVPWYFRTFSIDRGLEG